MSKKFNLQTDYVPTGDQPTAIKTLFDGFESGFMSCLLVNYFQRPENVPFFLVSSEEAVRRYLGVSWSYIEKFISA